MERERFGELPERKPQLPLMVWAGLTATLGGGGSMILGFMGNFSLDGMAGLLVLSGFVAALLVAIGLSVVMRERRTVARSFLGWSPANWWILTVTLGFFILLSVPGYTEFLKKQHQSGGSGPNP